MRVFSPPRKINQPRDYFTTLQAANRQRTDAETAILLAEIDQRYRWHNRQRREASPLRLLTIVRTRDLEQIFLDNYGLHLPDDDSGWDDLIVMGHHLAHFGGTTSRIVARIVGWAAMWAPTFSTNKVTEHAKLNRGKPVQVES